MRYAASGKRSAVSSVSSAGLGIGHDYWKVCVLIVFVYPVLGWTGVTSVKCVYGCKAPWTCPCLYIGRSL